jgi:hypothetical protein
VVEGSAEELKALAGSDNLEDAFVRLVEPEAPAHA